MYPLKILEKAFNDTSQIIATVRYAQMFNPTPCSEYDVKMLIKNTVRWTRFLGMAAAREPVSENYQSSEQDNSAAPFYDAGRAAIKACGREGALDGEITMPLTGKMPASTAYVINLLEFVVHGWDIAKATGQKTAIPEETATAALKSAKIIIQSGAREREKPAFGPEVSIPEGSSIGDHLIAFLGGGTL